MVTPNGSFLRCNASPGALGFLYIRKRARPQEERERKAKEEEMPETVAEKKEKGSEGFSLVVRAEPLEQAQRICKNLIKGVRLTEGGALLLEADPAWAQAVEAVLVERGVKVCELCPTPLEAKEERLAVA
jgi:hypothetical protein